MECDEVLGLLNDYEDDVLAPEVREAISQHLGNCPRCLEEAREVRRFAADARSLAERPVEPARDLWPGIEGRLVARAGDDAGVKPPMRRAALTAAAALVLAVLTGAMAFWWLERPDGPKGASRTPSAGVTTPEAAPVTPWTTALPASLQAAGGSPSEEYRVAAARLRTALTEVEPKLGPEARATVEQNLRIIEQAIGEIDRALKTDPGNVRLNTLLLAAYRREIDLLVRATQASVQM